MLGSRPLSEIKWAARKCGFSPLWAHKGDAHALMDDAHVRKGGGGGVYPGPDGRMVEIRDVWASNLDAEMANIRELVVMYPCVRAPRGRARGAGARRGSAALVSESHARVPSLAVARARARGARA